MSATKASTRRLRRPNDTQPVTGVTETVADAIELAQAEARHDLTPLALAEAVVVGLGLDPAGWAVVRAVRMAEPVIGHGDPEEAA